MTIINRKATILNCQTLPTGTESLPATSPAIDTEAFTEPVINQNQTKQTVQCSANEDEHSSCAFSSDDEATPPTHGSSREVRATSSARHAAIDPRRVQQKLEKWKGKPGLKIAEDPRQGALIPIHAPKMERLNKAKLKALDERVRQAPIPAEGDIVTPIINDINNTAEINYSVVAIGPEFVTQSEVTARVVRAENDPNSIRPNPPPTKQKRRDKVIPFPRRRLQAVIRE